MVELREDFLSGNEASESTQPASILMVSIP